MSVAGKPSPVEDPRVYLAAERTFLAWVRTSLALMGFGFLIARFAFLIRENGQHPSPPPEIHSRLTAGLGFCMICFGVTVCLVSLVRHRKYIRELESGEVNPQLDSRIPIIVAGILAVVGFAMAIHVLTL